MKKFLGFVFWILIFVFVFNYRNEIVNLIMKNFVDKEVVVFGEANSYYKNLDYGFVQNTDDLYPNNKQDILNIIYTTLNKGLNEVTFYCENDYENCINDVNEIAGSTDYLSTINNLVHPFNSYRNIYFSISTYGKVTISINKLYSDAEILLINNKINEINNSLFYANISNYDKIKLFHDYIINNTVYDSDVSIENQRYITTNANTALGLLFEGKAVCSGYSDTMAIFLSNEGFNNYKISSEEHIWNLVNIDGVWKHIDATWDDPVTSSGKNILIHDFFLIDTKTLREKEDSLNKENHYFNEVLYIEAK